MDIFKLEKPNLAGKLERALTLLAQDKNVLRFLENANSHSFDMHGGFDRNDETDIAGDSMSVHHNTFRATSHAAVYIRGRPTQRAAIYHNWFFHDDPKKAVKQEHGFGNIRVYRNLYKKSRIFMETEIVPHRN